ncbi:MAG TPA: hypothetical protein PLV45_02975 [bacterium]|nr:hypothetical protein [bacterium]
MYYLAHFLFESGSGDDNAFGYFTCIAEADTSDDAMDKFERQILAMSEQSDLFDNVQVIYLEDIIEFESLKENAVLTRLEIFPGERPPSANITLPDQDGAETCAFYRPVDDAGDDEDALIPFIEFDDSE